MDDVTRKDRIYCLKASFDYHSELCEECRFYPNCGHTRQDDLTELTIKDLEALEKASESDDDTISRKEVLDIAKSSKSNWIDNSVLFKRVSALTPVPPKTAHWIYDGEGSGYKKWHCSNCKMPVRNSKKPWYDFCPKCGRHMIEQCENEV